MSDEIDLDQVRRDVERCVASQEALVADLRGLRDIDPAMPSGLPDWTVAHVLTHIARNADGILRVLDGLPQYWYRMRSRVADIELGAERTWEELVADVDETCTAVAARLGAVADWAGDVRAAVGRRPKASVPLLRRREVEVHRADLGLGYGFADMPRDFVRSELRTLEMVWKSRLPMGVTGTPPHLLALADHQRLAWLFGRVQVPGVEPAGVI